MRNALLDRDINGQELKTLNWSVYAAYAGAINDKIDLWYLHINQEAPSSAMLKHQEKGATITAGT